MRDGASVVFDGMTKFKASIQELRAKQVLIGIPSDKNPRDDGSPYGNAQIGWVQENGSPVHNIPARPHLVPAVHGVDNQIADIFKEGAKDVLTKGPGELDKAYNKAGIIGQNAVKRFIVAQEGFEELADSTLAARKRKGFAGVKALIRSGQYLNAFTYVIRKKAGV